MKEVLVSIIVPCYNQATYLEEALMSVLKQTYHYWECIIINDGSEDNTEEVAKNWVEKDCRFKYKYQANSGLSSARNAGLKIAKGDYIQFLDSDDLIKSKKLELQILDLVDNDISVSDYIPFQDGTDEFVKSRYLSPFLLETEFKKDIILNWETLKSIPCHSVLFKMKLVIENKIYFEPTLPNHEDWVFWVKIFYFSKKIKNNPNILALYRIRNLSMCTEIYKMDLGFLKASVILENFFREVNDYRFNKYVEIKREEIIKSINIREKSFSPANKFYYTLINYFIFIKNKIVNGLLH